MPAGDARDAHAHAYVSFTQIPMPKIPEEIVKRVLSVARIEDVVSDFVQLRRSGKEYEGLCPFHGDKNLGSFKVAPAKNICTCFSCQESWDPVGFVMKAEGLTFPDAIRWLAKKYGIFIDEEQNRFKPKPSMESPPIFVSRRKPWAFPSKEIG